VSAGSRVEGEGWRGLVKVEAAAQQRGLPGGVVGGVQGAVSAGWGSGCRRALRVLGRVQGVGLRCEG